MNVPDWNRQHTLMIVIMAILAVGVYVFGYLYWIQPLAEQAETQQDVLVTNTPPVRQVPDTVTEEELARAGVAIPTGGSPADALAVIERIADETGVVIESVAATTDASAPDASGEAPSSEDAAGAPSGDMRMTFPFFTALPEGVVSYPHTVSAKADTLQNMNAFLDGLATSERYIQTDRLAISQTDGVALTLGVTVFSRE